MNFKIFAAWLFIIAVLRFIAIFIIWNIAICYLFPELRPLPLAMIALLVLAWILITFKINLEGEE